MDFIDDISALRQRLRCARGIAFVPTMGNLHQGHIRLVQQAEALRQQGLVDTVAVSVFVNRLQFAPDEDFDSYPRTLEADAEKLRANGCDVVFAPTERQLYPQPQAFHVHPPASLDSILEGHFRPGFFRGVCTVVHKLFNIVQPQYAIFGKKDYQQLAIVRQMVQHMALPVQIHGVDIVRDAYGLALSSRNGYFSAQQLTKARELNACLREVKKRLLAQTAAQRGLVGEQARVEMERSAVQRLAAAGWQVDYVAIRRAADLGAPEELESERSGSDSRQLVVLAAAALDGVRLIDNLEVELPD